MTQTDWESLGLSDAMAATLRAKGYQTPSPIQAQAIGPQISGRDILGLAQTGSGKTVAFVAPIIQMLKAAKRRPQPRSTRALILAPTRELAVQIDETARALADGSPLSTLLVFGGVSRSAQVRALARGVDIVVATPGRLTDLMREGCIRFDQSDVLVLDEADRMLDMGFVRQVQAIARAFPRDRRTALLSATMPSEVEALANGLLHEPVRVEVARSGETAAKITQSVELLAQTDKRARLAEILGAPEVSSAIVFARTKRGADRVAQNLEKDGVPAGAIHGNKSQNARQRVLNAFRDGSLRVLVASDIAARGIDVPGVSHVVQYDMPDEPEAYVHRIGRTGRNGADGIAVAFCAPDERDKLKAVEKLTKQRLAPEARHGGGRAQPSDGQKTGSERQRQRSPSAAQPDAPGAPKSRRPRRRRGPRRAAA